MRVVGRALTVVALIWGCLALPGVAGAVEVGPAELIAIAGEHGMGCLSPTDIEVRCGSEVYYYAWSATIALSQMSGLVSSVTTTANEFPLSVDAQSMMVDLQDPGCGDRAAMTAFVTSTSLLTDDRQINQLVGDCAMIGKIVPSLEGSPAYTVTSEIRTPPPPTDTPTPTPAATLAPTATPSPSTSPSPVATAASLGPAPTPTVTATAVASETPSASPTPSATASATAEQQVAAGRGTPRATPTLQPARDGATDPAAGHETVAHGRLALALVASAVPPLEALPLVGNALLVLMLLFFMAFAAELFNSTLESNYDEVAGWFSVWRRRAAGVSRFWTGPIGIALFMALGALVYAWLDPDFGPSAESAATLIGLLVGLIVVMLSFELPGMLMYRRRTGEMPGLRALPWTLVAAAVCVAISRIANLQPGYLYGLLLGIVFASEPSGAEEGRQTAVGASWTLLVSIGAWTALGVVRGDPAPFTGLGGLVVETALAVIAVGGLEAVAFGLLPMRFLAGQALYRWNRPLWAALLGIGMFAFLYLLVEPHSGYLSELPLSGVIAAFGVFALFGALSILFWSYFRFRRERPEIA